MGVVNAVFYGKAERMTPSLPGKLAKGPRGHAYNGRMA